MSKLAFVEERICGAKCIGCGTTENVDKCNNTLCFGCWCDAEGFEDDDKDIQSDFEERSIEDFYSRDEE